MHSYAILAVFVLIFPAISPAQTTGVPPFGSLDQVGLETRNNVDLNIMLAIPIMSSPGRNGLDLNLSVVYNSSMWKNGGGYWTPNNSVVPPWGWTTAYSTGQTTSRTITTEDVCYDGGAQTIYIDTTEENSYEYTDPLGTVHNFPGVYAQQVTNYCTGDTTYSGTLTGYASDGSGFYLTIDEYSGSVTSLFSKGGFKITPTTITGPNGNYISSTTNSNETDWTDSAGRLALKVITNGTSSIQYEFLKPDGSGYQTATLNLETLNIKTDFGCTNPTVIEYTSTASVPASIQLPNGQSYTFTYESYVSGGTTYYTGRLQKVTLPTGGSYEYDYTGSNDGISCTDGTTLSMNRTVSDGTSSKTWNYVRTGSVMTTITTPQLADTSGATDMEVFFNGSGQETQRNVCSNSPCSGTALRTIATTWAANGTPATQRTMLENGTTQSEVDTTYDSNGLLDSISEYDFGSGGHGSLIRTTTYQYDTSTNYITRNILNLVQTKEIKDGNGAIQYRQDITYDETARDNQADGQVACSSETTVTQHDNSGHGCSFYYRGNPTSVTTYQSPSVPTGAITKTFTYDVFGNLVTAQVNCCQNKTWVYSSTTNYAEPDKVTSGTSPSLTTQATYFANGELESTTDPNNLVTNYTYDSYGRPLSVSETGGGSVSYSYDDTHYTSTTTAQIDSSKSIQQFISVDGLGRPVLAKTEDVSSNVYSQVGTDYDLAGRAYKTSNPYPANGSPSEWTTAAFDALGRPTSIHLQDNSPTSYAYSLNTTIVTDPAGKQRESIVDAAGRLISVYEPDPANGNSLTVQTSYTYNVVDELTKVTEGSQTRTYAYDALGRLNEATTPEGGTVCYGQLSGGVCQNGYDSFDNLLYRTDARGVVTNYIYDSLNRLVGITYPTVPNGVSPMPNVCETPGAGSNNANVCFTYGTSAVSYNNGRLITMNDPSGSESYTYNSLGQMTQLQKVIGTTTYTIGYGFNLANELTKITYPSGHVVQQSVDAIGEVCEIAPATSGCGTAASPYATGFGYSAATGELTGFKYGNGIYASFGYSSDRLQMTCLDYSTTNRSSCAHDATSKFGLDYSYGAAGSNNGQISSISDYVQPGRSIAYTYDALYRMTQAATTGSTAYPAWGLGETYDRYGNRSAQSIASGCTAITCPTNSVTPNAPTNQLQSYGYDASGDMTNDGVNTLTYDGESRSVTASGSLGSGTYTYDGNGLRVKKVSGSTTNVYIFSGSKVIAEYVNGAAPSSPTVEYIYAGGTLLARIDSTGTKYFQQDHLSNRIVTDSSGNVVEQLGHFPFGESWYNGSVEKWFFTTYERDSESGNDYAIARYHVSRLGRLSSPDPMSGSTFNPQSLNRYAYSINDPANITDPSGAVPGCFLMRLQPIDDSQQASAHGGPNANDVNVDSSSSSGLEQGCSESLWEWLGGGGTLDGVDISDIPSGLVGGSESNANCPGGDCSILDQPYTAANGMQYYLWAGMDGYTWANAVNGEDLSNSGAEEVGLPTFSDGLDGAPGTTSGDSNLKPWDLRSKAVAILRAKNDCSKWFNQGTGSAAAEMSTVPILAYTPPDPYIGMPDAGTGQDPQTPIRVNNLGRFYTDRYNGLPVGGYAAGTFGAQMVLLLHELAHKILPPGFVSDDAGQGNTSDKNTALVFQHCEKAINASPMKNW